MSNNPKYEKGKNRQLLSMTLIIVLFVIGSGVLLYPTISDWWNSHWNSKMVSVYDKSVEGYSKQTLKREWKKAKAYNAQHNFNTVNDAFDNDVYIKTHPYSDLLNPCKDGIMGYLDIPEIDEEIVIYHGTGAKALEKGCGHVEGTSLPIGGKDRKSTRLNSSH